MLQPDPSATQRPGARCAEHPELTAAIICTRCGNYACEPCRRVGSDGRDYCFRCVPVSEPLADAGTRFVAVLIDQFSMTLPVFIMAFLGGAASAAAGERSGALGAIFMLLGVLGSFGVMGYQLYLLVTTGQSLGKRTMGIKVVRTDGSPIDLGRLIFLRNVVPWFIGVVTCNLFSLADPLFIFTADRRCLHDHIADTKVIKVNGHAG